MLLQTENISHSYNGESVLKNINITLPFNNTCSILGKSGCGKTTLLKIIAGITIQDKGNVLLNNNNINKQPPSQRNIVYMSQEPLLFPHLNVFDNIAFGLRVRKEPDAVIQKKVVNLLEQLGLASQRLKMQQQLSGGQKQRVNFGRALIVNPPLMLLDEPFGNLDAHTRADMQLLYKNMVAEFKIGSLFVTHDVKEAILMADSIGFMEAGNLHTYENKQAFINDEKTGAQAEINFWKHKQVLH